MKQKYKNILTFVWTSNMEKTRAFYTGVLGFSVIFESEGWIELSIPGTQNAFMALNRWVKKDRHPLNEYITLSVGNINDFKETLASKLVPLKGDIREFPEQGLRILKFFDPAGNVLTAAEVEN